MDIDVILAGALGLGALGVFALMVAESAGLPVPSEAVMALAGVAVQQGHMSLWLAVAAGTAGNVVGSLLLYAAGRRLSVASLPPRLCAGTRRCDALFARHGQGAVFVGRLAPIARSFISLPAGHARMPLRRFVPLTAAGCAIWSAAFVTVGALSAG